jgi:hypothetical protein
MRYSAAWISKSNSTAHGYLLLLVGRQPDGQLRDLIQANPNVPNQKHVKFNPNVSRSQLIPKK